MPDNHDLDRTAVNFMVKANQGQLLQSKSEEIIASLLQEEPQRTAFVQRHAAYLAFLTDLPSTHAELTLSEVARTMTEVRRCLDHRLGHC